MRNKITSLLTLFLLFVGTCVWAQTAVTTPQASNASAKYTYKMHCAATDHGGNYINVTDGAIDGRNTEGTLLEFISTGNANEWYIKDVASKKYLVVTSTANGTLVTLSETADCYWLQSGSFFKANGVGSANLNNNGALAVRGGTGGCSQWTLLEYVEEAQPLSWSEVKDGYTYAIVNVQPAAVGHNYYMNSTDGNLTPVDATGFTSISEWPATAQYVAEKQADGKFTFKNVANGQYLAYKSHNTGENGMKGFVDTAEAWSTWTMNMSSRAGFEGTYYPTCANRNASTVKASTLLVANNGTWNAWDASECTNAGYSNNYGFVELAAPTMPLVEFNYVLCFEGYTKNVPVSGRVGQPLPAVTIPNIFNGEQPTGTIAADQESIFVELTLKDGIMPFQYFEQSSAITQWYTLKMRDNYWVKYSATGDPFPLSTTAPAENDNTRLFGFVGNPLLGFKIVSYADGYDYRYVGATTANNSACSAIDNEADATTLLFEVNSGHKVFHVEGNAYLNAIASSTKLGVWNAAAASTDGGSTFTFAEVDVAAFDLTELKAEAIASLPSNISALYSAEDIATATAAINAVTCGADDESIRAAKEAIANAKAALLKTAEGKKVAIKSLGSYSTRGGDYYLTAEAAGTQMTSNTELTKNGVYELTYNEDANAYTVMALANSTYLPKTGNPSTAIATTDDAANAGLYTITSTENADQRVVLTNINGNGVSDSQGGVHLDGSKKIVVWGPAGEASKWVIEAVSDELWAEMTAMPDVTELENILSNINTNYYDSWNGVWRVGDGLNNYNYITEPAEGMDLVTYAATAQSFVDNLSSTNTDAEVSEIVSNLNAILANLVIHQPADGSFLRIRSVKNGMGYVNAEASSAHDGCLAVGGQKASSIFYYKDGKLLSFTEGQYIVKNGSGSGFAALGATGAEGADIAFGQARSQAGCYTVTFNGRYLYAADNAANTDAGGSEGNNGYNFWLEEVASLPVSISDAGYATLYAPVALTVPTGVKAYTLTQDGDYLVATEVTTIAANTGVVIEAAEGNYEFAIAESADTQTSCLSGTIATQAAPADCYTLANGEDGIGFYSYAGTNVKGFKAYFESNVVADAKGFAISFGEADAIMAVKAAQAGNVYDLNGRKVVKAQKGIFIQNGKKVVK